MFNSKSCDLAVLEKAIRACSEQDLLSHNINYYEKMKTKGKNINNLFTQKIP